MTRGPSQFRLLAPTGPRPATLLHSSLAVALVLLAIAIPEHNPPFNFPDLLYLSFVAVRF